MKLPLCVLGPHSDSCYGIYHQQVTCIGGIGKVVFACTVLNFLLHTCTGSHWDVNICFCNCHSEAETLVKLGFFPATPVRPSTAFQFLLLDKLEAFMLECQVSLKDFLAALNCYTSLPFMQVYMHVRKKWNWL